MVLQESDISSEFAERLLDKIHLAMTKIDPYWQDHLMQSPDSPETNARITKLKIQSYGWVLKSSDKELDTLAKKKLYKEFEALGDISLAMFLVSGLEDRTILKGKLPTQAQLKAGNYKKKHIRIHGFNIAIENKKGSYRSGIDPDGKKWKCKIHHDYGYIKRTMGADGDHVDVFLGNDKSSEIIFVINQVDPKTRKFDEHKAMIGFPSSDSAKKAYLKNYDKNWKGLDSICSLTLAQFKTWLEKGSQKRELIDPEIEFLKSDLSKIIQRNKQEIKILKSQLGMRPITIHGKYGTYVQIRKVKLEDKITPIDKDSKIVRSISNENNKRKKIFSIDEQRGEKNPNHSTISDIPLGGSKGIRRSEKDPNESQGTRNYSNDKAPEVSPGLATQKYLGQQLSLNNFSIASNHIISVFSNFLKNNSQEISDYIENRILKGDNILKILSVKEIPQEYRSFYLEAAAITDDSNFITVISENFQAVTEDVFNHELLHLAWKDLSEIEVRKIYDSCISEAEGIKVSQSFKSLKQAIENRITHGLSPEREMIDYLINGKEKSFGKDFKDIHSISHKNPRSLVVSSGSLIAKELGVELENGYDYEEVIAYGCEMSKERRAILFKTKNRDLDIIKSRVFEILKAKRRNDGETWTQPSGRKVTKKNGKIIPVPVGRKKKTEPTPNGDKSIPTLGKEFKSVIRDGYDHSKLMPGKVVTSKGKKYKVIKAPIKRADGKMEAVFQAIEVGEKLGSIPSKAIEETTKGGFANTESKVMNAVAQAVKKTKTAGSNGIDTMKTEKGVQVPTSLPVSQIRRMTQYTNEKDFDKDTINSLKERILENGFDPAFPIMVDKRDGVWTVVAGHHRHTAVEQLIKEGLLPENFQIPVVTKEFATDNDRLAAQVSENQRRSVLPTDESKAYGQMVENGWDAKRIADKLGKKVGDVNKRLALNNLDTDLFNLVKRKDKSLPLGVAEVIGMFAKDVNGEPSHSMQIRAFKWFVENRSKYPGRGPSVVQSFIKELQSGELTGMDFDSVASDSQREALRTLGSAEKAITNKKMIDGMLDSLMKSYQRILGENIGELNAKTIKDLAASLTLTGGSVGGSPVIGRLDTVIQDLTIIKDRITQKMREIESDSQMPMMFGMAKSTLFKTGQLIDLFSKEKEILIIQKGKVA